MSIYTESHAAYMDVDLIRPRAAAGGTSVQVRFWLLVMLLFACTMVGRDYLILAGLPMPPLFIAVVSVIVVATMYMSVHVLARYQPPVPMQHGFTGRITLMWLAVALLALYGIARGNPITEVVRELLAFAMILLGLVLGKYDSVWRTLRIPLIVTVYVCFVLTLLTYHVPGYTTDIMGQSQGKSMLLATRNTNSIAFGLRPIIGLAILLGAWGLVRQRTDIWRILQIGTLVVTFVVNSLIFSFRGTIFQVLAIILMFAFVRPIVHHRLKLGTVFFAGLLGLGTFYYASTTELYQKLMERLDSTDQTSLFETRNAETQSMFSDMSGLEVLVGRGLGAWFPPPYWVTSAPIVDGVPQWRNNHYGVLSFVLRGGIVFLLLVGTFAVPVVLRKPREWYDSEYNLTAFVLAPVLLLGVLFNPFGVDTLSFFLFLMWGMCFARFSIAVPSVAPQG